MGRDEQMSGRSGAKKGEGGSRESAEAFQEGRGGGSDAGWGSTNLDAGPGKEAQKRDRFSRRTSERAPEKSAEWKRIYAPRETAVTAKDETAPFKVGEGPSLGSTEVRGVPQQSEKRYVPYDQAPRPVKSASEGSLERAPVPREYRDAVRRYFDDD